MRRRTLLASAGAALLAGCLGTPPGSPRADDGPADNDTTTGRLHSDPTDTRPTGTPAPGGAGDGFVVSEFAVSTTKVAPPKRYYLRVTAVYSDAAVEREGGDPVVRDVSEIADPDLRRAVKDVLSEGKLYRDDVPDGLRELAERVDFFTWAENTDPRDTATHWGIGVYRAYPDRAPVVEFDAELLDDRIAPDDPGAIEFSLTNTGDTTQSVFSGTVPPFSVLRADGPGEDDSALLWRPYTEEGCVNFGEMGDEPVMYQCDIGVTTPVDPGQRIARRYELPLGYDRPAIAGQGFDAPGRYSVEETLSYHREGQNQGPSTEVEWTVAFDLRRP